MAAAPSALTSSRICCAIPANCKESDFHGPYNKLLNYNLPPDTDFIVVPLVVPQYLKAASGYGYLYGYVADFIVSFEIRLENKPVLIVQLKGPTAIQHISTRAEADDQIRGRIIDLAEHCPLDTLHAVSAFGTRLCFYSLDVENRGARIDPRRIDGDPDMVNDYAPAVRWSRDVLEASGEDKLLAVIDEIKAGCAQLS
ncbi:hypothetical protein EDB89DRAFT_2116187 [Lactarius sanguifluus]|nr:hypothetical protein EDB89DRAFT_2116187 [Lactarius sanguifluus]